MTNLGRFDSNPIAPRRGGGEDQLV
jgi:hypothetical protein